jgi:hypothetical protein
LPVLSYFVFVHAKYWLCICVARLELFCVCSRQVLIVHMCFPSWVILCLFTSSIDYVYVLPVFLWLFTPIIDCVFVFPVLSYFVFVHAKYWLCICVARLELFCVCSRQVLIVYMRCPSWVILCLFTSSIDCVYVLPLLSYFVFVHAKYWLCICVARLEVCCVCSRLVLIVYMRCPSWVILCLLTPSIDYVHETHIHNQY